MVICRMHKAADRSSTRYLYICILDDARIVEMSTGTDWHSISVEQLLSAPAGVCGMASVLNKNINNKEASSFATQ